MSQSKNKENIADVRKSNVVILIVEKFEWFVKHFGGNIKMLFIDKLHYLLADNNDQGKKANLCEIALTGFMRKY